ncbi:MAG: twin-arginine translocase subunit TatC [Nitrososphaeraceae archaeon]
MTIGEHLDELRFRLVRVVIAIIVLMAFFLTFGLTTVYILFDEGVIKVVSESPPTEGSDWTAPEPEGNSYVLTFYYPNYNPFDNIAIQLTTYLSDTLLPPEVSLIQTTPGQAFFSQVYVAVFLSMLISIPLILREVYAFVSPGLGQSARKVFAIKTLVPTVSLFVVGVLFSYVLVIPLVLNFLYTYGASIGVATFFNINDFYPFVLQLLIAFGLAFQLPVIMYALTLTGIVDAAFWKKNFRYAVIIFVIFGAVITPDGGGISMWLVVAPMMLLYLAGLMVVKRSKSENNRPAHSGADAHGTKF